jgi:ADP-ribose pyrophosphatase
MSNHSREDPERLLAPAAKRKVVRRSQVLKTPYFSVVAKRVEGDGLGDPYYAVETLDYVTVVAVTARDELVLVRQFRPVVEAVCLELPSGHVDDGETPEASARRELFEETGYTAAAFHPVCHMKPDIGRLGNRLWAFFAPDARPAAQPWTPEPGVERLLCSNERFRELLRRGEFDHALNLAALMMVLVQGKLPAAFLVDA